MTHEWGSREWKVQRDAQLLEWFGGDTDALKFLHTISDISEYWDDLEDADKDVSKSQRDKVFFQALITLPADPFYAKHQAYLLPIMVQAINCWHDANMLEKRDSNCRALAYTLRNMDVVIIQAIVYITQGYVRMREISPKLWVAFAAEQDDAIAWIAGERT